jgi:acyl-CoA thioester hydrolase
MAIPSAPSDLGRASLRFDYRVLRGAELLALGHTVHACVSRDGNMQEFPEPLLDRLRTGK